MAYERKHAHPIGTPGFPLPVLIETTEIVDGKPVTVKKLGVIESGDNPYVLHSAIPSTATVLGKLMRSLPSRSMLPLLEELLDRAQLGQKNFTAFVRGNPAVGKSYAMIQFCYLRDPRGPLIADLGGQSMETLLFRTVFNTDERKSVENMVDEALREGTLSPVSLKALQSLGTSFDPAHQRVDWDAVQRDTTIDFQKIDGILSSVFRLEGWDSKSSSIGFKIQDGPLIIAAKEGRDLLVDESNKSIEGSEMALQIVAQVLNGETNQHLVSLGGKGHYELINAGVSGKGNLVLFTGNYPKDGTGTREMSDSWNRRLPPFDMPDFSEADWQDRTGSLLTGLPLSILHEISRGKMKGVGDEKVWTLDDPAAFTDSLLMLSTLGMTEAEKLNVKDWQTALLSHWETTLPAVRKLGSFYHKWSQLVDADSPLMKQGDFPDLLMEIEDPRMPTTKVTPSDAIRAINNALVLRPGKKPSDRSGGFDLKRNWDTPVSVRKIESERISTHFGTRLVEAVMAQIDRGTIDKPHLRAQIMEDAKEAGLIGTPPPLAKLLNIDVSKDKLIEAKNTQNLLCVMLRRAYPDLSLSENDDDLLPLRHVQAQLDILRAQDTNRVASPFAARLHIPQSDMEKAQQTLFRDVTAESAKPGESIKDVQKRMPAAKLVSRDTLLTALALPVVGKGNVTGLWNKAPTNGAFAPDEAMAIAENVSDSGVAATTVVCRIGEGTEARYETLQLLRNSKLDRGRTVIMGDEPIADEMYDRLKRNKIVYINRRFPGAATWINSEVRNMVQPEFESTVKDAFLLRNDARPEPSLADLLAMPEKSKPKMATYVTERDPREITQAAQAGRPGSRLLG